MAADSLAAESLTEKQAGFSSEGPVRRPLPIEQFLRLRRQLPPMYLILTMNAATLAYTHIGLAPRWLSVWLPAGLIALCLLRLIQWLRPIDEARVTEPSARKMLRTIEIMAAAFSAGFVSWALVLDQYGGATEQAT